jgi:FkbM family methyltransferase
MGKRSLKSSLSNFLPYPLYRWVRNRKLQVESRPYRIGEVFEDGSYNVTEGELCIRVARRGRHSRYVSGIQAGINRVADRYHLNVLEITPGGCFIDCGANIGELGYFASAKKMAYVAVEPESIEANCCDTNCFAGGAQTKRLALWNYNGTLELFTKPDTGDSSLIRQATGIDSVKVDCRTLERLCEDPEVDASLCAGGTNILKVEAEGAEPEILEGAIPCLHRFNYVVVDCGRERGPEHADTFLPVYRTLIAADFEIVAAEMKQLTFAFKRSVSLTV